MSPQGFQPSTCPPLYFEASWINNKSVFRYRVDLGGDNWRLILRDVKVQDTGVYCCHVATHPPLLKRVQLTIYRKYNELSGKMYHLT